jgi:hypothetical protein
MEEIRTKKRKGGKRKEKAAPEKGMGKEYLLTF